MVPVLAVGFTDIEKRMEIQRLTSEAHKAKLTELDQRMKKIQLSNIQENAIKLMEAKRQYMELVQRVIKVKNNTYNLLYIYIYIFIFVFFKKINDSSSNIPKFYVIKDYLLHMKKK